MPRQEELQSSTTPLTMLILISLFAGFIVTGDPEGTLAHVCAFIPTTAPITMPGRIILGAAPAWEIAASVAVMVAATLALIPLAGSDLRGGRAAHRVRGEAFRSASTRATVKGPEADSKLSGGTAL